MRSYAAEAITTQRTAKSVTVADAQQFVDRTEGNRQVIESEPGIYRQSETIAPNFKFFELATLLPGTGFDLHISKIADSNADAPEMGRLQER